MACLLPTSLLRLCYLEQVCNFSFFVATKWYVLGLTKTAIPQMTT